jgi:small-conductance mechanosensitive channel
MILMNNFNEFAAPVLAVLNYPLIVLGTTSITLSLILFNLFLILAFLFISTKAKDWLIAALSRKAGLNISNWRAMITLSYYGVLGFGLIGILQATGLDLSLFTVLTGAIGIGVGFGMQSIFANFISGVIILLEKPLKLGDRVVVGDVAGNVRNISVRATTIVTNDNISIIVPNSDFISKQVINWSHSGNTIRISTSVSVAYNSDPELVQKLLLEVAHQIPGILKNPEPTVRLSEFGESGLRFSLLIWTEEYSDRIGSLKSLINFSVLQLFRKNKISMPFPQREVHMHNVPAADSVLPIDKPTS